MDYGEISRMASAGIDFFSGANSEYKCIIPGVVTIVDGVEVSEPEKTFNIYGLIRAPRARDVDGEMIKASDKLGVFKGSPALENGYFVIVDGEKYRITESRPIRPSGVTVAYRPILRRVSIHG